MSPLVVFSAEPQVITVQELQKALTDNRKETETQYLQKNIIVRGIVVSKGISRYLTPNVVLSVTAGGPELVICVLPRADTGKLSDFQIGQTVAFSGRVQAMSQRVVMKECKVYTP